MKENLINKEKVNKKIIDEEILNPSLIDLPAFLMCAPFTVSNKIPNNAWMKEEADKGERIDRQKALNQWLELYNYLSSESLTYLLPNNKPLQDIVFTANLGIVLEHLPKKDVVVLSNFTSKARVGEELVGKTFFESLGYKAIICPYQFEGEAELKHIRDNIYIGGYGQRSTKQAYEWMEKEFDMNIIKLEMKNKHLYHLDCSCFPITKENLLLGLKLYSTEEIKKIEKVLNIIPVSIDDCYSGICNNVKIFNTILNASYIHELTPGTKDYAWEIKKNRALEDIVIDFGMDLILINLSEFLKSGALLSCMIMHLNRLSYNYIAY